MPSLTMIKAIVGIAIVALIAAAVHGGYTYIKGIGYQEAETKYLLIIKDQNDKIATKIDGVEKLANGLISSNKLSQAKYSGDIKSILNEIQGKPLYYLKDGQCTPTVEFSDSLRKVIQRSNQEIKDSQK